MKLNDLPDSERRVIRAWCMYDWANSAFATSGVAAIFPVYFVVVFTDALGPEAYLFGMKFTGSSLWSLGAAISTAAVALTSPLLGVIADRVPIKKLFLWIYTIVGSVFTVLAFFSAYTSHPWAWLFGTFLLANTGFAGCLVFYNALLTHVSPRPLLDDISSRGFAYGYIGGGLLLLVHLVLNIVAQQSAALDIDFVTRASIASIGFWWFGWGIWTLVIVPEPPIYNRIHGLKITNSIQMSFGVLMQTFREITKFKVLVIYLIAYLLFNDGIQTIMAIAGAFAADTLDIPLAFNMMTILIIQFVAAGGAMGFSWLSDRTETKTALLISLVGWSFIVLFGVALAPLEPATHSKFDYQLEYESGSDFYIVQTTPELRDSVLDDSWLEEIGLISEGQKLSYTETEELLGDIISSDHSRHSISIAGGILDGNKAIGSRHPANLGSGQIDSWPIAVRNTIWAPLGIDVQYQWLILGVLVGLVMGGSQALARSLFAQMVPDARSGEFFSFFGFVGRASTVFGPMLYVVVTGMFDTRLAVTSILVLIIAGTLMLRWVDVQQGIQVAVDDNQRRFAGEK